MDRDYRRVSKGKQLLELEAEIARLRKETEASAASAVAAGAAAAGGSTDVAADEVGGDGKATVAVASNAITANTDGSLQDGRETQESMGAPAPFAVAVTPQPGSATDPTQGQTTTDSYAGPSCLSAKQLGNVSLSAAQASECFRIYMIQCNPYLELPLTPDLEAMYKKCPLLFWVICAVTSDVNTALTLHDGIKAMVADIVNNPPRSIETVQALLIMCMWPFPFGSTLQDPSCIYSGVATQIGLQIGLHRPSLQHEFSSRRQILEVNERARRATWLSCYIVTQMQTSRLGIPQHIHDDYTLTQSIESQDLPPNLVSLARVAHLSNQFSTMIGANAPNLTGLVQPFTRVDMVGYFHAQLTKMESEHLDDMLDAVRVAHLTAKLHLWSFILHDDIPQSPKVLEYLYAAEEDAGAMVMLGAGKNLSRCPWHLTRSVLFAALVLVRLLTFPHIRQPQVVNDQIMLASRSLQTAVRVENDHAHRWSRHLPILLVLRDKKATPPVRGRMAASLAFDTIRVMKEQSGVSVETTTLTQELNGLIGNVEWFNMDDRNGYPSLDSLDWASLAGIL